MALTSRERRRDYYLRSHGIDDNYMWEWDKRYLAILAAEIDGEHNAAGTFDSLTEAAEWLSGGYDNDNPRRGVLVVDLDTGTKYEPTTHVSVTLKRARR